jgi:hypothetical protein
MFIVTFWDSWDRRDKPFSPSENVSSSQIKIYRYLFFYLVTRTLCSLCINKSDLDVTISITLTKEDVMKHTISIALILFFCFSLVAAGQDHFPFFQGKDAAQKYFMIEGHYYKEGEYLYSESWYTIHNIDFASEITVGKIYIMKGDGIEGDYTIWMKYKGEPVAALGGLSFRIGDTGVAPSEGPYKVIILFDGPENACRVTGRNISYDGYGNVTAAWRLEPFSMN